MISPTLRPFKGNLALHEIRLQMLDHALRLETHRRFQEDFIIFPSVQIIERESLR